MEDDKDSIPNLILQPYVLDLLKELKTPKRFTDLNSKIKSRQTLTVKLKSLSENGLIKQTPVFVSGKYANGYVITNKGRKILNILK